MSEDERIKGRRQAVALSYGEGDSAPRVVARGYGLLAQRIIEEARRQGIYVHDQPELVELLMQLDIDRQIPERLYRVIAEVLLWALEPELADEINARRTNSLYLPSAALARAKAAGRHRDGA